MLLALLLFVGAAGLIFAYLGSGKPTAKSSAKSSVARSEKFESAVNKHLMYTNDKVELQKRRVEIENARVLHGDSRQNRPQTAFANDGKLDLNSEDHASEIAKELGRVGKKEEYTSPDDIVQREVFRIEQAKEYNEAYKEEYARQFVENARRGGYKVILSEDMSRVLSVTPIRNPSKSSFDVFGSGEEPLQ